MGHREEPTDAYKLCYSQPDALGEPCQRPFQALDRKHHMLPPKFALPQPMKRPKPQREPTQPVETTNPRNHGTSARQSGLLKVYGEVVRAVGVNGTS